MGYQQMVRFEGRLRPDQVGKLDELRRRVAADRGARDQRITNNTLVRVAIDLLLAHAGQLAGDTEQQLRASVVPDADTAPRAVLVDPAAVQQLLDANQVLAQAAQHVLASTTDWPDR